MVWEGPRINPGPYPDHCSHLRFIAICDSVTLQFIATAVPFCHWRFYCAMFQQAIAKG